MIVYNVTSKVDNAIASAWVQWIKEEHIPDMLSTGCFTSTNMLRLLELDDTEGPTYAVQYFAENKNKYEAYLRDHASNMRQRAFEKWGNKFISFRSVMEVVK